MSTINKHFGLKIVICLTGITMAIELFAGTIFNSLALLSDGWHMLSHLAAFAIAYFAERYARKNANNQNYTFGIGKVRILGGFASAVALGAIAVLMALESATRLFSPSAIQFNEAIAVAIIGLIVNLISAILLDAAHHSHQNQNLKAASLHVLADVMTSVGAIAGLVTQKWLGLSWIDPAIGLIGAIFIAKWSVALIRETTAILLDRTVDHKIQSAIVLALEENGLNTVSNLQIWKIGENEFAANISLIANQPQHPQYYKNLLRHIPNLFNLFIEVNSHSSYSSLHEKLLDRSTGKNPKTRLMYQ